MLFFARPVYVVDSNIMLRIWTTKNTTKPWNLSFCEVLVKHHVLFIWFDLRVVWIPVIFKTYDIYMKLIKHTAVQIYIFPLDNLP
jgi:hypothetical protein